MFRSACGLRGRCGGPAGPPHPLGHKTLPSAPSVRRRVPGRRPGLWRAQRAKAAVPADAAAHLGGAVRTPTGTRDNPSVRLDASRLPLLRTETSLRDVPVFRSAYYRRKPHRGFSVNARSPAALRPSTMREACGSPCSALKRPFGTFQCFDRLITEESPTGASLGKRSISSRFAAFGNAGSLRLPLLRTETPLRDVPVLPIGLLANKAPQGLSSSNARSPAALRPPTMREVCGSPYRGAKRKRDSLQKRESRGENRIS